MKLARLPDGSPEIFHTLQGEGRSAGLPSVFIRSSLCNLHCRWCDTDYTWNWVGTPFAHDRDAEPGYAKYRREDQIVERPVEEIANTAAAFGCTNYVFTGGEPLLHEPEWIELMAELQSRLGGPCHFEIETNGTRLPGLEFLDAIDQINVSPKLSNSGMARELRLKDDVLRALAETGKADFKFVIETPEDLSEADAIVNGARIAPARVFLMPQGAHVAALDARIGWLIAACQSRGYRLSDRLHLRWFGARRGV
jgi:7-carboxy-7-deazaguanine synthase